ncbi:MAG: electron transfer flavoprotein subunit beta/FixA family protein [Eggerthellaceae bacterium]|jgi:electron transfer flavoprotein beta subunit
MSTVVACFKWVLDEGDISVHDDGTVDFSRARGKISDYDRQAIQAAVDAAAVMDAKPVGLTVVASRSKSAATTAAKEALVRGLAECYAASAPEGIEPGSRAIAKGLTVGLDAIDDIALVVCGSGSSDLFARQIAPRIAAAKGWPVVTAVSSFKVDGRELVCRRTLEHVVESVRVTLPAVITVLPSINQPRLPGMRAILEAKKRPIHEFSCDAELAADGRSAILVERRGYVAHRKNNLLKDGTPDEAAAFLMDAMRKEGVL